MVAIVSIVSTFSELRGGDPQGCRLAVRDNLGHDHQARHLLPDGTCKFAQVGLGTCDKWVWTRGLQVGAWALTLALSALTPTAAMPRSSPSSSEGPGFTGAGELRMCVFSTNAIPSENEWTGSACAASNHMNTRAYDLGHGTRCRGRSRARGSGG